MQLFCSIVGLLLALYGLSRLLIGLCVRLTAGKNQGFWVLPLCGDGQDLELYLRFARTVHLCGAHPQIYLVDVGLEAHAQGVLQRMCERDGDIRVISAKEAENLLQTGLH